MTAEQLDDICRKQKNCKQNKIQFKKIKPAVFCLAARALRYVWYPEEMFHSKENKKNQYIVRYERVFL